MAKIFRGVTPAAKSLSRVWSIMKLIFRFSISIIKDWSGPPSLQVSSRIKSLTGHRNSNGSTALCIRSKHSGAEQMVVDIHRSSDGGLDVRNYQPGDGGLDTYLLPAFGTPTPDGF